MEVRFNDGPRKGEITDMSFVVARPLIIRGYVDATNEAINARFRPTKQRRTRKPKTVTA